MATATAEKKAIKKPAKKVPLADTPKEVAEAKPTKSLRDSDRFAIIETGGKQYRVSEGDLIKIEKIKGEVNKNDRDLYKVGDTVVFEKVLLKSQGVESDNLNIGAPFITGATVTASIIKIARHPKNKDWPYSCPGDHAVKTEVPDNEDTLNDQPVNKNCGESHADSKYFPESSVRY